MTTAAEVLEKVLQVMMEPRIMELATIRAGENCNKHNIAATIRTAVDEALRAALAPPQAAPVQEPVRYTMWSTSDGYVNPRADPEGAWVLYAAPPQAVEVEECIRLLQAYLPVRTLGEEAQHGGLPETLRMAIRLLRATQSNAPAPSAPAQEPVAWIRDYNTDELGVQAMTDTETPRTNEAERTAPWPLSGQQGAWKFARTLERELIGAQAELEAITEAIGTRDGHSSVPHVIALKATIAEQAKEIERLREALGLVCDLASQEWQEEDGSRKAATDNSGARLWFVGADVMQAARRALGEEG